MRNLLIVLSGPSGVGKGTIVGELKKRGNYSLSVSCTTRAPRECERDGEAYFFITREKFVEMLKNGGFLEYSEHFGNYYGTPAAFVKEKLKYGDVLLEIDVDGALQVKRSYPSALLIMIAPPSEEELIKRLKGRGSEEEDKIRERLKRASYELSKKEEYDYTVINDDLGEAVGRVERIIKDRKEKGI